MSERIYPDWVQKQKTTGTTVKKVGNNYYLYKGAAGHDLRAMHYTSRGVDLRISMNVSGSPAFNKALTFL